ncbi:MAG: hypothetical protein ACM31C_33015 [Acidobacteriota bacterium]
MVARWASIALVAVALVPATHADPASAQAEVMFRNGKRLLKLGKIAEACAAFDASEKLGPTISTRLNQANCREKNNQLATAWGLFLDAERDTRSATDDVGRQLHQVAADHADKLEARLSTLEIRVPAEARVEGLEIKRDDAVLDPAVWNQALPIDGGTYRISARGKTVPAWSTTVTIANEKDFKVVELPRRAVPAHAVPVTAPARPAASPAKTFPAPESWYCTASTRSKIGICKPQLEQCSAFRARMIAHVQDLPECAAEWSATCFLVGDDPHCAPSAEICGAMRDAATRAGTAMVGTCDVERAKVAPKAIARAPAKATGAANEVDFDEPSAPVWSCTESAHSAAGTCKLTAAQCQVYRKRMSDRFPDLTECHGYLKAQCFDLGKEAHCAPNAEVCNALREAANVGGKCTARAAK